MKGRERLDIERQRERERERNVAGRKGDEIKSFRKWLLYDVEVWKVNGETVGGATRT